MSIFLIGRASNTFERHQFSNKSHGTDRQVDMIKLSNKTPCTLPENIVRPCYDRSDIAPGILHIGLGNCHRAHQSWYLHRLLQQGLAQDWGILGAGVTPYDTVMRAKLHKQDCLTTLVELDPAGTSAEVVGSMIDYVPSRGTTHR